MEDKKGQVSLFVIIGVILILVVGIFLFTGGFDFILDRNNTKDRVSDIVENCIYDSATRGVFLLGFQGGYIELPKRVEGDPRKYVDFGLKIPNWDSINDDVPSISSMEFSLENFVLEDAHACIIGNLDSLDGVVNMEYPDTLIVSADINKQNVAIETKFPVRFNDLNSEEVVTVEDFFVNLDSVRLGDMFDLAGLIYKKEADTYFAEDLTMEQIYGSSDYRTRDSMPSEGMVFSCAPQVWTVPQLKENLASLNNNNFKYLQFEGTYSKDYIFDAHLNEEFGTYDLRSYFENKYYLELNGTKDSYSNYLVEVIMPSVEVTGDDGYFKRYPYRTFEVTPSDGQIVKPINLKIGTDLGPEIPIPCMQIYHTLYTLDYDLIVRVTDLNEDAKKYLFQFPLRVNIKDNEAKFGVNVPFGDEDDVKTATDEAFCSEDAREYPVTVYALDAKNGGYISGANITYECIDLSCNVGETQKLNYYGYEYGSFPFLNTNFPYCVNGKIVAEKEGYYFGETRIDTTDSFFDTGMTSIAATVELTPTKKFEVDESSFLVVYDGSGHRIYEDDENKSIFVSVVNRGIGYSEDLMWPSYVDPDTGERMFNTIELLDDDTIEYNVSVYYQDEEGMKALMEIKNWTPEIHDGNGIFFTIPASGSVITENSFVDYYENMERSVGSGSFGISFR